jgi:HAE1 family hydrophobic/amphiphilic exporter-1
LKDWAKRAHTDKEIMRQVTKYPPRAITEATIIAVGPPPIPGLGNAAGFTLQLQDRAGNTPQYLAQQAQAFIAAAKQRPEIGSAFTLYRANVPQKSITCG